MYKDGATGKKQGSQSVAARTDLIHFFILFIFLK